MTVEPAMIRYSNQVDAGILTKSSNKRTPTSVEVAPGLPVRLSSIAGSSPDSPCFGLINLCQWVSFHSLNFGITGKFTSTIQVNECVY